MAEAFAVGGVIIVVLCALIILVAVRSMPNVPTERS